MTTTPQGISHCITRLGSCPDMAALRRVWSGLGVFYQRHPSVIEAKDAMKRELSKCQESS